MNCHPMHGCPHGQDAKGGMPQGMKGMGPKTLEDGSPACRLIAWEVTRSCNLACRHCRADAAGLLGGIDFGRKLYGDRVFSEENFSHG